MKSASGAGTGGVPSYAFPAKRRWRGLVIGVLGLVILSMLVPLVFLLGLHNGFHSPGYIYERQSSPSKHDDLGGYDRSNVRDIVNQTEGVQSKHVEELIEKLKPTLPKDTLKSYAGTAKNETVIKSTMKDQDKGLKVPPNAAVQLLPTPNKSRVVQKDEVTHRKSSNEESGKSCELTFGSYCLWRQEHREEMKDAMIKKLKDKLFVARAYYPSIAKLPTQDQLSRELKQNIQDLERVLSESTTDADLPPQIEKKLEKIEVSIAKSKSLPVDCNNVDKKLRQIFDLTEDEADFHMKQSAFLYKLTVQTMPKSLHCLSLKLTVEYFKNPHDEVEAEKFVDSSLHHYVIFSKNVLAASVVINSTVTHAKESSNQVFHVLTDGQNYYAMKLWFFRNKYKEAAVQVLNVERLDLDSPRTETSVPLSLPEEFRVTIQNVENSTIHTRTEYISIFSHSHYLLPDIFSSLKKIVVLDDDVVVQRDLSPLWTLSMGEKVNGAMQFCSVRLGQLKTYLGEKGFDQNSCAWMSGLNVINLVKWRELGLTQSYGRLIKELSVKEPSTESVAWRASLLAFEAKIFPLDDSWVLSGLGHDYMVDNQAINKAAVLHYNGNMKPWLDMGIPKYRSYWRKFINIEDQFLSECNVYS